MSHFLTIAQGLAFLRTYFERFLYFIDLGYENLLVLGRGGYYLET